MTLFYINHIGKLTNGFSSKTNFLGTLEVVLKGTGIMVYGIIVFIHG